MNAVILAGYITSMQKGPFSLQFTIKTSEPGYCTRKNVRIPDRVDYHICHAQSQISSYVSKNFKIGDSVQIYGKLQNALVDNKEGGKTKLTFIKVLNVNLYNYANINLKTVGKFIDEDIEIPKTSPFFNDFED